ncbi:MAG: peptide deformylase [Minisyncoccia bacterium]
MSIVQDGNTVLRQVATPIEPHEFGGGALHTVLTEMAATLDAEADGVALAAPQIGVSRRVFIVRYDRMEPPPKDDAPEVVPDIGVYINPVIKKTSRKKVEKEEGCLSVRGTYGKIMRYTRTSVEAYDEQGKKFSRGAGGLLAQAFQHEIDHLEGKLFIDTATNLKEIAPEDRPQKSRAQENWKLDEHA